jgi:hypothetical protein
MERKVDTLRGHMAAGRWREALAVAAKFYDLGDHAMRRRIQMGHEAFVHPRFYQELGRDTEALIADACAALRERYGDPAAPHFCAPALRVGRL